MSEKSWTEPPWGPNAALLLKKPTVQETLEADWAALRGTAAPEGELPRLSEEKLREFVLGVLEGTLYTSAQVSTPEMVRLVFLPIALGALKDWTEEQRKNPANHAPPTWVIPNEALAPPGKNGAAAVTG